MEHEQRHDEVLGVLEQRSNGYWCCEVKLADQSVTLAIGVDDARPQRLEAALEFARQIVNALETSDAVFRHAISDELLSLYNDDYRLDDDPELDAQDLESQIRPRSLEITTDPWQRLTARMLYDAQDLFDGRGIEVWIGSDDLQVESVNLS